MEYVCNTASLYLTVNAASSDINGRFSAMTGKIMSGENSFDVSAELNNIIIADDVLTRGINVQCNQDTGAFRMKYSTEVVAGESTNSVTTINIYADGYVTGSKSRRRVKKDQ